MATVLIVDDQSTSRMILEELIRSIEQALVVESFADPIQALEWAKRNTVDLVLTDYKMPYMDGSEFTRWLRQIPSCSDVPVIIITCVDDRSVRYRALEVGATDFLTKPVDHHECRARCRNLLTLRRQQQIIKERAKWLEHAVSRTTEEILLREKETLLRLARAGEYRDEETGNHVVRMARCSRVIADGLRLSDDDCDVIEHAAPMHDIGKIGIPDRILLNTQKLNGDDWEVMKTHTTIGYEILRDSPSCYLQHGAFIALSHHERFDGNGYPRGRKGDQIPIEARVVAVADVYDALVSWRPYKKPWPMQDAIAYIRSEKGRQFDPDCVDAFNKGLDEIIGIQQQLREDPNNVNSH